MMPPVRPAVAAVLATTGLALEALLGRGAAGPAAEPPPATRAVDPVMAPLRDGAATLTPLLHTALARQFLAACAALPSPPARVIFRNPNGGAFLGARAAASLPDSIRSRLEPDSLEQRYYYQTRYGTILNYARIFEILGDQGVASFEGRRILDFGYGRIGHLRALASLGADAVGVDIDPMLGALYSEPGDSGSVRGGNGRIGRVSPITGWFPGDSATRAAVGSGFDLVISKNTLKGGSSPEERARQRRVIDLGVSDATFVRAIADGMKPRGLFIMYTISSPRGNPRCPFAEQLLREAGFEILAYDRDDSPGARAMMTALDSEASNDPVTALYTVVRKTPPPSR